ncbi:PAS domain-containing protein [Bradyrhizobium sp. dw_411]|uniref:PAS domain-containing protein n=1 Tax=Bradyrhizobium sp. dw_411 TaxID=2720082 RepID=UPI0023DEFD9C|nr:PAS domain-containing protein [Bradyrhizobium sp. dw_411]
MSASILPSRPGRPAILDYGIACIIPALALALDVTFNRLWGIDPSASLFLCGIVLVAWISGPRPALLATVLTVLAFDYFLIQPVYSFALEFRELSRLVPFTIAALFMVSLSATQRRAIDSLRHARDKQRETVEELRKLNETLLIENAERARAEENTRRAEQELQLLVDNIPVLAARYRADGSMDFRNKVWRDYTGLSQDNAEGHRWGSALHPDDREMVERAWRAHIASGEAFEIEQRLRRTDGEYRWHWIRRVPLRDDNGNVIRWYGVGFDIEDRRLAEEARRQSEEALTEARHELQLIIDTIPVLVLRHRADGIIDFVNQVGRTYSGRTTTKWTTRTSVITHPDDVPRLEASWDVALATGGSFESEVRLRRYDGEYRWFATRRVPLRKDGKVIAWYAATYDIEDRKRAEDALRASEAQLAEARRELQLTIDTIATMIVVLDQDGNAYFANKPAQDYIGHNLSVENVRDAIHPDDRARVDELWRKHLASGEPFQTEQRMRRADGEYRWNLMTRVPRRDETGKVVRWYGSGYDIEDRKRAEDALRASEAELAQTQRQLQLTIDSIPVMVSTFDADGSRSFVNRTWQTYTGHDQKHATGKGLNTSAYYHPDDLETFEEAWRTAQALGEMMSVDVRTRRADGVYRWYTMRRAPQYDERGNIIKWYSVGIDVEDRKIAESALHTAQAALAHASRVATLGEISATIAHEVNQPLGAIVANGQACLRFLQRETPDLNDVRGAIEWIVKDGNRAGEVIRRVRGLLKKADIYKLPLDVNEIVNEVVTLLRSELNAKRVTLRLELAPAIPQVIADRVQLQQVIINLVMNGIDAMQTIRDRPHALLIRSCMSETGQVVVAVSDSGIGIPDEITGHLFDAFFSTKPGGLGMGLSICRSIIEDHGGRLWPTENRKEPGATFQFALPGPQQLTL